MRSIVHVGILASAVLACGGGDAVLPTVAQVEPVRGGVTVREGASAAPADEVLRLRPGATVETDASGRALLSLDEGDRLLLDRGSSVRITDATHVELIAGRAWITAFQRAARDPGRLELRAGGGVLRVRGARASVAREGARADVDVLGGEVAFDAGARQGTVHAGEHAALSATSAEVSARTLFDDWTGGLADDEPEARSAGSAVGLGAVAARRPEEQGAPRWPLVLQRLESRVRIVGDLAVTELEQTFFNPASDTVEGLYTLTVPRGAVLQRFAVDRRGTFVDGTVRERQSAARAYQSQVYAGSTLDPALLEWDAPGRYHARLYPIGPGQTRRILVTYSQWLHVRPDGGRSWRLPLATLGTRIGELYVNVDLSRASATEVRAGLGAIRDDDRVVLTRSDLTPRADFVVDLRGQPPREGTLARIPAPDGTPAEDRSAFVRVALRAPVEDARRPRDEGVDMVLLVDHSAATDPAALQLEQAMAEALTRSLGPRDRLLVLAGDVRTRAQGGASATMVPATPEARAAALDALAQDRRGGATDLGAMIEAAQGALDPRRNGVIVYLGDGRATVGEDDLAALRARIARMTPRPRLYAVAVGEDARLDLLSGVAEPAGFATRIQRRAEVARAAVDILAHASRPLVRNLRADLGPDVERVYPTAPVDLPAGDSLVVVGRITARNPPRARVRATWQGADVSREVPLTSLVLPAVQDLRARWATARLDHLLAQGESRTVIVELGTRFGLITPFTSLYVPAEDQVVALESPRAQAFSLVDLIPLVGCTRDRSPPTETRAASTPSSQMAQQNATAEESPRGESTNAPAPVAPAQPSTTTAAGGGQPGMIALPAAPPPVVAAAPMAQATPAPSAAMGASPMADEGESGLRGHGSGARPRYAVRGPTDGTERARDRTAEIGGEDQQEGGRGTRHADPAPEPEAAAVVADLLSANQAAQAQRAAREIDDNRAAAGDGDVDLAEQVRNARRNADATRALARCSDAAAVPLIDRLPLWQERLSRGGGASGALGVWTAAKRACELPAWPDKVALLRLMLAQVRDVDGQFWLYQRMRGDTGARDWVRAAVLRTLARTGELARAHALGLTRLDDATLTAALAQARTPQERLNVLRQLARRFSDDLDLALLLLDAAVAVDARDEVRRVALRLREDPRTDARVRTAAGEALLAIGDESEARRAFSEIVEFSPDDPFARRRLGDIALAHGWADEAYRQYQTLSARSNEAPEMLLRLAWAARLAGRLDESIRLAERVTSQSMPGATNTLAEAAAAWIASELALAGQARDVSADVVSALRARWRRSPAARTAGALRVVLRWMHPDDDAELWVAPAGEPNRRADLVAASFPLESVVFAEAPPSMEIEVRRGGASRPRGEAELVVIWNEGTAQERVARERVRFDADHARAMFSAQDGRIALRVEPAVGGAR